MLHVSDRVRLGVRRNGFQFQIVLRVGNGVFLLVGEAVHLLGRVEASFRLIEAPLRSRCSVTLVSGPSLVSCRDSVFWSLGVYRREVWLHGFFICEGGSCWWSFRFSSVILHGRILRKAAYSSAVRTDLLLFTTLIVISVTTLVRGSGLHVRALDSTVHPFVHRSCRNSFCWRIRIATAHHCFGLCS